MEACIAKLGLIYRPATIAAANKRSIKAMTKEKLLVSLDSYFCRGFSSRKGDMVLILAAQRD